MEFEKLIAISGYGSLFKVISQSNFGLVAESLEDKKRMPVYQSYNVSTLSDISIYTNEGEIALKEVLIKLHEKESGGECKAAKEKDAEIKKYFETVLPDYDKEKVYISDIKKVLKWYNQLIKNNLLDPEALRKADEEKAAEENTEEKKEVAAEKGGEEKKKPAKKEGEKKTKTTAAKTTKPAPTVKNAPAKKVQTVRKSGGS